MADYPRITLRWLGEYFQRWMRPGHGLVTQPGWFVDKNDAMCFVLTLDDTTYPPGPRRFEVWIREVPPMDPKPTGGAPWTIPH